VITGLGMITPVGADTAQSWAALMAGRSGVRAMLEPEFAGLPVRIAAPLPVDPVQRLARVEARRWDRNQQLAVIAAREAWADAGYTGSNPQAGLDTERLGVVLGTGIGGITAILAQYDLFRVKGWDAVSPYSVTMSMPNAAAAVVGLDIAARAGVHAPVSSCATGGEAIGQGVAMIRDGRADIVLAGGTEAAVHPFTLAGFAAMRALSRRNEDPTSASRPFDVGRDGFVVGEGAGALILESEQHAVARGARIYAEVAGVGLSSDPYHVARTDPAAPGAALAMRRAIADAGIEAGQVAHVNAHATSTPAGDRAEAAALRTVLSADTVISATKSMTGHLLGGAGAVEAAITALTVRDGVAPPTINLDKLDPDIGLNIVTGDARPLPRTLRGEPAVSLSNSFGFGGHNVSLAFRRWG
jgi:3-oxoacyl-[acyl-carrier-protein] synthase II